jgi:hypothetical protein
MMPIMQGSKPRVERIALDSTRLPRQSWWVLAFHSSVSPPFLNRDPHCIVDSLPSHLGRVFFQRRVALRKKTPVANNEVRKQKKEFFDQFARSVIRTATPADTKDFECDASSQQLSLASSIRTGLNSLGLGGLTRPPHPGNPNWPEEETSLFSSSAPGYGGWGSLELKELI